MNRISKEFLAGGRNFPAGTHHQRGRSLNGIPKDTDENLDLFSRNRRSLSIASPDEPNVSMKLKRLSLGSATLARSGMDDLISSGDGGKHDYDWLLTPPGTPLFSSSGGSEPQPAIAAPRSITRSPATTKSSRLSVSQSENSYSSRPGRSNSVTRPSISTTHYTTYSSNTNRSSSILNTSSASVNSSSSRPSTPGTRSSFPSVGRPSTPSSRPVLSRSSTPVKSRTPPTSSSIGKTQVSQSPRPSTPSTRPQTPSYGNSPIARSNSRPSTPTRRNLTATPPPATVRSSSAGRVVSNGRNQGAPSRGSSPSPRVRVQPIVPPDFPLDTPPNLRTTLPDRPVSAGRSRPGVAVTARGNLEVPGGSVNPPRRQSSPIVARGRLPEPSRKGHLLQANGNSGALGSQKTSPVSEPSRRPAKPSTANESTGFGRTISKKSLDMALRHMDIRHGTGSIRSLSGTTTLFPQSVRGGHAKSQPARALDTEASISSSGSPCGIISNGGISENGNYKNRSSCSTSTVGEEENRISAKIRDLDVYESSRYDAMLLKEDLKNTNWLSDSDQGLLFDHRFEPLPEPFGLT